MARSLGNVYDDAISECERAHSYAMKINTCRSEQCLPLVAVLMIVRNVFC